MEKDIEIYQTASGQEPFTEWFHNLRDGVGRAAILARLARTRLGNLGDHRSVRHGIAELRIHVGPAYRIHIGLHGQNLIIVLCGGSKSRQRVDIALARQYWEDWNLS